MDDTESDREDFARHDAHPDGHHREPAEAPTSLSPARNPPFRRLVLAASTISLLLLVLLVYARCGGQATRPPVVAPTATAIPPFVAAQLTATAVATELTAAATQLPLLEQRPLHLPTLAPGAACPLVPAQRLPYSNATYGPALGQGPVYALGFNLDGTLSAASAAQFDGGVTAWGGQKLQWVIAPGDVGPVVVRGQQLDGSHALRFNGGLDQADDSDLAGAPPLPVLHLFFPDSTTVYGTYVRLQAPGCYAMQVDGLSFSEVIIFKAVMNP